MKRKVSAVHEQQITDNGQGPFLPYGRQVIDEADIEAVVQVLRSDWLTTGPKVEEFEQAVARYVDAPYAVAVSSGTAALHAAMYAIGVGPGDEVIVPAMTFAATANTVVYQGGTPVFADVEPQTLLLDPREVAAKLTPRTKAVVAVDYAGQPCDYEALRDIVEKHGVRLIADACHALGASCQGKLVGGLADLTVFSFHPVKHLTTGEGGMVVTTHAELAARMRMFRNHGISSDHRQRDKLGTWYYEMTDLGYNYRLTDFQCALGLSQLQKLSCWLTRRWAIAGLYNARLAGRLDIQPLKRRGGVEHAYHLYVIRCGPTINRRVVYEEMRAAGIGVNVHYIPVHLHPYYQRHWGTGVGLCRVAEKAYDEILSLPIHAGMTDLDVDRVLQALTTSLA
jgi:perosamine synthetase